MRTRSSTITVAGPATVAAMALALGLALDAPAVRMIAALAACLVLPGLGWARRLRLKDLGDTLAMTVVLSLSLTAVVATGMAVSRSWSPLTGLAILAALTLVGFVPVRAVISGLGVVVLGRTAGEPELPVADLDGDEDGWKDWYADARARSDEERRRRAAEAEAAEQDWRDWYAETRRATARERSRRWGPDGPDGPGIGPTDEADALAEERVKL